MEKASPDDYDGLVLPGGQINPDDAPAFNAKLVEEFAEGRHQGHRRRSA